MALRRPARPLNLPDLSGVELLVVDDHEDTLQMLLSFLRACGASVMPARTVALALGYIDTAKRLDAIVTDLAMPWVDGVTLANHVRAHRKRNELPIIAVTGYYQNYADQLDVFDAVLQKPVDFQDFCNAILTALGRHPQPRTSAS